MSAAKIRAPHAFNASRSFVISVFIHEHSLSTRTRVLGVKSGEQGDKSVSLMRVVPKPSHAVCFWSWANSQNTRVCVSEQSGVQTSARRVSENTRVCGVLTKAKKGAGSRQPLAALVGASRIAHRLLPTRAYPSDTLNLPTARHTTKVLLPHAGGGELYVLRKVWPTEFFPTSDPTYSYGQTP